MNTFIGKTPFARLLLPAIVGIITASYIPWKTVFSYYVAILALLTIIISLFINNKHRYRLRWLFGAGITIFIFALSTYRYSVCEKEVYADFPDEQQYFVGTITDLPETKPRSIACAIKTTYPTEKRIILYLEQTNEARSLLPGNELLFKAKIQPFKNFGNPDDFDYAGFMKIKGVSATAYVPEIMWCKTGRQHISPYILSQRCRGKILNFYNSFQLGYDAYAFFSAVTLGYKSYLSDDLQEAFRASGTAHILAVSGLHVGIIYAIINFAFSFLGKRGHWYTIRQILTVITLWAYALMAGMSAPIIRASFMLTIYCIGQIIKRDGFTYNTLAAAAFFLLILKPFSLYDVSFLMSFTAVFAIIFFLPIFRHLYTPNNKISRHLWNLSSISLSAQLGVFPLVLYFFGSFPTYFFIANILVVPLLSFVIYSSIPLIIASLATSSYAVISFFRWIPESLINLIIKTVHFTETLPFAQLTDKHISVLQLFLLTIFIYTIAHFITSRKSKTLIIAMIALCLFFSNNIQYLSTTHSPQLVVFNTPSVSDIGIFANNKRHYVAIPSNGLIPHNEKSILRLSNDDITSCRNNRTFPLDIIILSEHKDFNIDQLLRLFSPKVVIIDSSMPFYAAQRLKNECDKHNIKAFDVSSEGAYYINF